jgi:hypothetical protein
MKGKRPTVGAWINHGRDLWFDRGRKANIVFEIPSKQTLFVAMKFH